MASAGDEVLVRAGEYIENLSNVGVPITLRSTSGAAMTTITAAAPGDPVVLIGDQPEPFTTIDGFTIRGGNTLIGGGVEWVHTRSTIRNCIIRDNSAFRGGGVFNFGAFVLMENCLITNNVAEDGGGGVFDDHGFITAVNCTIVGNVAGGPGGGIAVNFGTSMHNSVLWGNTGSGGQSESDQTTCDPSIGCSLFNSCVQGLNVLAGNGNIGADPLFVDSVAGDFRLQPGSPCIDAGDNTPVAWPSDLDGTPRRLDDPATADTGVGIAPIVDMGVYEFGDDCNNNGIADKEDIAQGTSDDCNVNGVPDECEPDCNGNQQADDCDIALGSSDDCTLNGIPDECEPDCNTSGTADTCDIANGLSEDCNGNFVPDDCDVTSGASPDDDANGIPDECQQPIALVEGSRYVHFVPPPSVAPIALYLTSPDYPCLGKYIGPDGSVIDTPVYLPSVDWPPLDVSGAELWPGTGYRVGVESIGGQRFPPVSFETWAFGNVVENTGVSSFADISAIVDVFQGNLANTTMYQADLHPCAPDGTADFVDVSAAVVAFQGGGYATLCAPPCVAN